MSRIRLSVIVLAVLFSAVAPQVGLCAEFVDGLDNGIVRIHAFNERVDYRVPWNSGGIQRGTGTGFYIGGDLLMTNAHVVSNARHLAVKREGDPQLYPARVRHVAHDCDLALIEVDGEGFFTGMQPLSFGELPALQSTVHVVGYPIGGERISVTRGVVSRIEFRPYAHTGSDSHLAVQIDAAINPGNSGGPVFMDGRVVGVAFQGVSGSIAQNTGYMIPPPVVKRFLDDVKDGSYDGYVELGVGYFNLTNPSYRAYLGLPANGEGVVITRVVTGTSADGVVKDGDVMMAIDGHAITADGKINLDGQVVMLEEIVERKFNGDQVKLRIIRDGEEQELTLTLKPDVPGRMNAMLYDEKPRYLIFGGLVFQPLDRNMLTAHGISRPETIDMFAFYLQDELFVEYPEVIILTSILADPINTHLGRFTHGVVESVNGVRVPTLADLDSALNQEADRYVIRFVGEGVPLVITGDELKAADERIRRQYGIREAKYLTIREGGK